ncbi:30S ribosomal protein S8, partial [Stenotrophomonas sp. NPDC078853]
KNEHHKEINCKRNSINTTTNSIMTDAQARQLGVGGEVLCFVA